MPKAEVGSTKHLSNKLKSKGLQRLRWYCQVCEKQCRDANGFKMHTQSESHVRQMLVVGEDPKKFINDFSNQFLKDFLQLLKTGHGDKQVHMNQFYQEYIANKKHIHMNATKWPSLTELAKHLGKEGICRVEETEKGLHIAWIDNSPDALKRQEALRRKEAMSQGDEALEQRMIQEQIKRAQVSAGKNNAEVDDDADGKGLQRQEGEKITLSFGSKQPSKSSDSRGEEKPGPVASTTQEDAAAADSAKDGEKAAAPKPPSGFGGISLKMGSKPQTKNVFSQAKKNALSAGTSKKSPFEAPKKMSAAERIMKEEMERKRSRPSADLGTPSNKKQRH